MAIDQIRVIRDCEKECQEKKKAATSNARHIVAGANKEAAAIIEEARETAKRQGAELLKQAQEQGQKQYDILLGQAQEQSAKMLEQARKETPKAVDIIIKRVVSSYGNS